MDSQEIRMRCIDHAMKLPTICGAEDVLAAALKLEGFVLNGPGAETLKLTDLAYSRDPEPFTEAEVARMICNL